MSVTESCPRIVIVGGGITGLAAARRCLELAPRSQLTLLEAGSRLGGVLATERRDGFLIEHSADNFITNVPWALDLCRRVGCEAELIATRSEHRRAQIVFRGRLVNVPRGYSLLAPGLLWPMLTTPLLSLRGKLRLLAEPLAPRRRGGGDESLASFGRRRFGVEVFERLIQPLVGGIYTADPERLSLAATLPRFLALEERHRSLISSPARRELRGGSGEAGFASGARYGMFVAPRDGMDSLVARIAQSLGFERVRLNSRVASVAPASEGGWLVTLLGAAAPETIVADAVIVTAPAARAAEMLVGDNESELATALRAIEYASSAVVSLGYRLADVGRPLDAFGFVVPACEKRRILAASFSSVKYPGRAPEDALLARVFIGGACQSELLERDDGELIRIAREELGQLLAITGSPIMARLTRWSGAMPQYTLGHLDRVEKIETLVARRPGLALAGAAYRGVGIPNCIHSAEQAAERIMKTTTSPASPTA